MANEETMVKEPEVKEEKIEEQISEEPKVEEKPEDQPMEVHVDSSVAFQLKLQEFDKNIATAKAQAAELERQKIEFIYNHNIQKITEEHKTRMIQNQIEEETRKKLQEKK